MSLIAYKHVAQRSVADITVAEIVIKVQRMRAVGWGGVAACKCSIDGSSSNNCIVRTSKN